MTKQAVLQESLRDAFLRAILEDPADDSVRLIFADFLEEHAGTVPCGKCKGTMRNDLGAGYGTIPCAFCEGGRVSDGNAERAELIRVQCELEGWRAVCANHDAGRKNCPGCVLRRRERELLDGAGEGQEVPNRVLWLGGDNPSHLLHDALKPSWQRGFVAEITCSCAAFLGGPCGCVSGDYPGHRWSGIMPALWEVCKDCSGTGRTPGHAGRLFSVAPIRRVTLEDRRPEWSSKGFDNHPSLCGWGPDRPTSQPALQPEARLPETVLSLLEGYRTDLDDGWYSAHWRFYDTEADALSALSNALVALGRGRAGLPELAALH